MKKIFIFITLTFLFTTFSLNIKAQKNDDVIALWGITAFGNEKSIQRITEEDAMMFAMLSKGQDSKFRFSIWGYNGPNDFKPLGDSWQIYSLHRVKSNNASINIEGSAKAPNGSIGTVYMELTNVQKGICILQFNTGKKSLYISGFFIKSEMYNNIIEQFGI